MRKLLTIGGVAVVLAALAVTAIPTLAADHLEAPLVQQDGRTDINDLYAFRSPTDSSRTVLIMTVNPVAGVLSPTAFDPRARYDFLVDDDGDAVADHTWSVRFSKEGDDGSQTVRVHAPGVVGWGDAGDEINLAGGGRAWTGLSDDPFFFDLQAFLDQVKGVGGSRTFCDGGATDFFTGLNVSAIVLEVPSSAFVGSNIGVWARTWVGGKVVDRMGRPAIATVLIPDGSEDAFNATEPADDRAVWGDDVKASLMALGGYTEADARGLADILLPDVLTLDTSSAAGFLNGRRLQDDVIDAELGIVTAGALTSDCVDANDLSFPGTFPYVAEAH
jgi:hypothetical protein